LKRNLLVKDEVGDWISAKTVFALSIKYLKDHLMNVLEERGTRLQESDVFWVLTVPAIWDPPSRQFMREAAMEVGQHQALKLINLE
jgi:hypothetical protein